MRAGLLSTHLAVDVGAESSGHAPDAVAPDQAGSRQRAGSALGLGLVLALAGCTKYQDMARIEASIREGVERQASTSVLFVDCPPERPAKPGDRFQCRVGIEGGAVTIDLVQDDYANVQWTQRESVLDVAKLEATIHAGLREHLRVDATVTCPGRHRPSIPGTRFECTAATVPPNILAVTVVVKNTKAEVDWSVRTSVPVPARR